MKERILVQFNKFIIANGYFFPFKLSVVIDGDKVNANVATSAENKNKISQRAVWNLLHSCTDEFYKDKRDLCNFDMINDDFNKRSVILHEEA